MTKLGSAFTVVTLLVFCHNSLGQTISCGSTAEENKYETIDPNTNNTVCYPAWYGAHPSGGYYTIVIPGGWQSTDGLILWNHGIHLTVPTLEDIEAELSGLGELTLFGALFELWKYMTDGEIYISEVSPQPSLGEFAGVLLSEGYAVMGSTYTQEGWALFDSHLSNKELYDQFLQVAAAPPVNQPSPPSKFHIIGGSMGALATIRDMEEKLLPNPNGAILACGAVGGSANWNNAFDLRLIYDAVCREVGGQQMPKPWHQIITPGEIPEMLISIEQCTNLGLRYLFVSQLGEIEGAALWETLADSKRKAAAKLIAQLTNTDIDQVIINLGYAMLGLPYVMQEASKLEGINPFSNEGINYGDAVPTIPDSPLAGFDINSEIERVISNPQAEAIFRANYESRDLIDPTSKILSIHTSMDNLVTPENQRVLQGLSSITPGNLFISIKQELTPSHCSSFTNQDYSRVWQTYKDWADPSGSGTAPTHTALDPGGLFQSMSSIGLDTEFLRFPRDSLATVSGANSYNTVSERLTFSDMRYLNFAGVPFGPYFSGQLVQRENIRGYSVYDVDSSSISQSNSPVNGNPISGTNWLHTALYDPIAGQAYIPEIQGVIPVRTEWIRQFDSDRFVSKRYPLFPLNLLREQLR